MSKRNSDGDVLANRVSLALASSQKRLASMLGPAAASRATPAATPGPEQDERDEQDFRKDFADPEQLGVGGIRPKDIEDAGFTRRTLSSDDKLLQQLIGKKKAQAHVATKQQAARLGTQPQPKKGRQAGTTKDESEDEEEGRAAAFKSKRTRRSSKPESVPVTEDNGENRTAPPVQASNEVPGDQQSAAAPATIDEDEQPSVQRKAIPSRGKAKPKSYLDELLAERSTKKKKKTAP